MPDDLNKSHLQNTIPPWKLPTENQEPIEQKEQNWERSEASSTIAPASPESPKPKRLNILFIITSFIGILVVGVFVLIFGSLFLNLFQTTTNTLPVSNKIEKPRAVYLKDNKLYIEDEGNYDSSTSGFRHSKPVIWVYEIPSGNLLNQVAEGSEEYKELQKIVQEVRSINKYKSNSFVATSSTTGKKYQLLANRSIGIFDKSGEKLKELSYLPELLFSDTSGYIYFASRDSNSNYYLYKLNSESDKIILKKKFPVKQLAIQIDYYPFISEEGVYLLPMEVPIIDKPKTLVVIYDLKKDEFLPVFKLEGSYRGVFAKGKDVFLVGEKSVVWVDRNSGKIIKRFTGK